MIGLLQSGTGIGNGICLPIASSGLLARCFAVERLAVFRLGVGGLVAGVVTPPVELPGVPAPLGPRTPRDPVGPGRAPLCADLRLVALPADVDADAGTAVEPTDAAVAVVAWPPSSEAPPPELVAVPALGLSVGVLLDGLGVDTVTGGCDPLTGGVVTLTSGVFTVTPGVDTVTDGTVALTAGVETVTDGVDTVTLGTESSTLGSDTPTPDRDTPTSGSDTPTPESDTPTPGSDKPTLGNETAGGVALGAAVLETCSNPAWASAEPPPSSAAATPISDAPSAIGKRLDRRDPISITATTTSRPSARLTSISRRKRQQRRLA